MYNLPSTFSDKIGVNNDLFEFNRDNGSPIIYVNAFYLNNKQEGDIGFLSPIDTSNIKNYYDSSLKKYEFNIIELKLPTNINKDEIFDLSYSDEVKASFISSVQISYNTPSHYKVTLNRTFSNIFAAKLVSSEIPNTAFSFNGVEISTNIGKNKLRTKVNNRLRWINESDSYKFSTYTISDYKLYANANPYFNDLSNETIIQNKQNEINKRNFNRNIHPAIIKTCCYENVNITSRNKNIDKDVYITSNNSENNYYIDNYNNIVSNLDLNDIHNTIYLDGDQKLDNLSVFNSLEISENDKIIIPQQNDTTENNIYQINKNVLVSFFIFNSGSNYSLNDLQFFKFYKIDNEYSKYNVLQKDNNNNDILNNIDINLSEGSINNLKTKINFVLSSINQYKYVSNDFYFGTSGYLFNTHFIDKSLSNYNYTDKRYYNITNYIVNITNNDGTITTKNILDNNGNIIINNNLVNNDLIEYISALEVLW